MQAVGHSFAVVFQLDIMQNCIYYPDEIHTQEKIPHGYLTLHFAENMPVPKHSYTWGNSSVVFLDPCVLWIQMLRHKQWLSCHWMTCDINIPHHSLLLLSIIFFFTEDALHLLVIPTEKPWNLFSFCIFYMNGFKVAAISFFFSVRLYFYVFF